MNDRQQPAFEIVEDESKKKFIFIGLGVAVLLIVGAAAFFFLGGKNKPAPQAAAPPVKVVAQDPAQQAEVDKQVAQLRHFIQNPTADDAVITVGWVGKKYGQSPEIVVRDLKVLVNRLKDLSDEQLAAFFNSQENPWLDDPSYNSLIKLISHRDYVGFVEKCAIRYEKENLNKN